MPMFLRPGGYIWASWTGKAAQDLQPLNAL